MCIVYRDDLNEDDDDSAFLPADASSHVLLAKEMPLHRHLLSGTSPASVQRRATVSGASPTVSKPPVNIEDLVNGVSRIKNSETFSRSISHDSACHKLSVKPECNSLNVKSDCANDGVTLFKDVYMKNGQSIEITSEVSSRNSSPETVVHKHPETVQEVKSEVSAIEILPVQEEDTLLENKSLTKIDSINTCQKEESDDEKHGIKSCNFVSNEVQAVDSNSNGSKSSVSSFSGMDSFFSFKCKLVFRFTLNLCIKNN